MYALKFPNGTYYLRLFTLDEAFRVRDTTPEFLDCRVYHVID